MDTTQTPSNAAKPAPPATVVPQRPWFIGALLVAAGLLVPLASVLVPWWRLRFSRGESIDWYGPDRPPFPHGSGGSSPWSLGRSATAWCGSCRRSCFASSGEH
jgi:hypothetical protein